VLVHWHLPITPRATVRPARAVGYRRGVGGGGWLTDTRTSYDTVARVTPGCSATRARRRRRH